MREDSCGLVFAVSRPHFWRPESQPWPFIEWCAGSKAVFGPPALEWSKESPGAFARHAALESLCSASRPVICGSKSILKTVMDFDAQVFVGLQP